jgi:hypothetical protein
VLLPSICSDLVTAGLFAYRADENRPPSSEPARGISLFRIWLLFPAKWLLRKLLPERLNFYAALSLPRDHMLVSAIRN